jgi:DNA polymerase I-like protein with 3'-5' exonuclease and polymerase domains
MSPRLSIDLETACRRECAEACKCALVPHLARITLIGVTSKSGVARTFRTVAEFAAFIESLDGNYTITGQNFAFDYRMLDAHGLTLPLEKYQFDTQIAGAISLTKVPDDYLEWYRTERERLNKSRPAGHKHRVGTPYSLKVMAPYFLKVEPFWEPENHDDEAYNLKDCYYTDGLTDFFTERLKAEGLWDFYTKYQMPWARQLLKMSIRGVNLDMDGLARAEQESLAKSVALKAQLDEMWAEAYKEFGERRVNGVLTRYQEMCAKAVAKLKDKTPENVKRTTNRYHGLARAAMLKVETDPNLASPDQLAWILRDYFGLDITDWEDEESTAKAVLQKLIREGRKDIEVFLAWRQEYKLLTGFYPTLRELQRGGKLHTSFNPTGARTGRISSSMPNMQQCPPHVRALIVAPPGKELAVFDMSAVEPRIIAYYSDDKTLFDLIQAGHSFHDYNAKVFFNLTCPIEDVKAKHKRERMVSKTGGLGILYGSGAKRLQNIGITQGFDWALAQCKAMIETLRNAYPGVKLFKKALDEKAKYAPITGYFGQKYAYPDHEDIYMKAFNTVIQGSASQMVVDAAMRIDQAFEASDIDGGVLLAVHDELVVEIPEGSEAAVSIIKQCMTSYPLRTPWGNVRLEVEGKTGKRWEK